MSRFLLSIFFLYVDGGIPCFKFHKMEPEQSQVQVSELYIPECM